MKRFISRPFSPSEAYVVGSPEALEFDKFLDENLDRLGALGDFRNWYVMNNQDLILDKKVRPPQLLN